MKLPLSIQRNFRLVASRVRAYSNGDRLIQLKIELRFRRDLYVLAFRHTLIHSAAGPTYSGTDSSALSAAGDRANQRAQHCATADFLGGILSARITGQRVRAADKRIRVTLIFKLYEFQAEFALARVVT